MSTTLHAHPPRTRDDEQLPAPRLTSRRPTLLDRLALRLGLLLITYGRRRYAASREELAHRARHLAAGSVSATCSSRRDDVAAMRTAEDPTGCPGTPRSRDIRRSGRGTPRMPRSRECRGDARRLAG